MRIAIVQETLDPRRGGAETSVLEMTAALRRRGLDVTLVSPGDPSPDDEPGLQRIPVSGDKLLRTIRFVGEADRYLREQRFDIVHAVTPCHSANVYQPRGGTYAETIEQTLARVSNPLLRAIKRMGRRFNRRQRFLLLTELNLLADRRPPFIAAVSQYVAEQIPRSCPNFPQERIRVVFNGIQLPELSQEALQRERPRIREELGVDERTRVMLFAAHNFALKGLNQLLTAVPKLDLPDWQLWIVGGGHTRLPTDARIRALGPRSDMSSLFAAADCLAHPTWYDPCSRVVLEALAHGLPVMTTRFNGAAEIVRTNVHGTVIDRPDQIEAMRTALQHALDPSLQSACRTAAEDTKRLVSMDRHAEELERLYEDVCAATARARARV